MGSDNDHNARPENRGPVRQRLWEIIFGTDTPGGRSFDLVLLWLIGLSVLAVMLESVDTIRAQYGDLLLIAEWFFTIIFTIEYVVRLAVVRRPLRYATSFFGIIDLISIIPTYLMLFDVSAQALLVVRILRLLRIFRILKMIRHLGEASVMLRAMRSSVPKITVFFFCVLALAVIMGSIMYIVEGNSNSGFTSIPRSVYWAVVTVTTVGYGDIAPATVFGQVLASCLMMMGYVIIAVPTGLVGVDVMREMERLRKTDVNKACGDCGADGHRFDAKHCYACGERFVSEKKPD